MSDECRYLTCSNPTRDRGDTWGENDQYTVGPYGAKFCSQRCELRYDHVKGDARDAARGAER